MIARVAIFDPIIGIFTINNIKLPSNTLGENDVLVKQIAFSIHEIDVVNGLIKKQDKLGSTAYCEIQKVGNEVKWLNPGDKVVYFTDTNSFCDYKIINQQYLIKIPSTLNWRIAVSILYRGCLAHMLVTRVFIVRERIYALVDNINCLTSAMIAWYAKKHGAFVIGISSTDDIIPSNVCDAVIKSNDIQHVIQNVLQYTQNFGAHVYFNSINCLPIDLIMRSLSISGVYVDYLNNIAEIPTDLMYNKSLFFTTPNILHYKSNKSEIVLTIDDVLAKFTADPLNIDIIEFPLEKIDDAFTLVSKGISSQAVIVKL